MTTHRVTLIPGDWVGPETCDVARAVIDALGVSVQWDVFDALGGAVPTGLVESAKTNGVVLKARLSLSHAPGEQPVAIQLRRALGLFGRIHKVTSIRGIPSAFSEVDLRIVREISEDIYSGLEHETAPGVYELVKVTTRAASARIARLAFDLARREGRKRVTVVHKSNIMKESDGMFLSVAREVASDYPEIACDEVIVDALCMKLVVNPGQFDVLLCGNLYGDIVSDLAAGLCGGLVPSVATSYGDDVVVFENPHGRAEALVGTGRANPIPMLVLGHRLLEHLGETDAAARLRHAVFQVLEAPDLRTTDLGGTAGCPEIRDAVIARL